MAVVDDLAPGMNPPPVTAVSHRRISPPKQSVPGRDVCEQSAIADFGTATAGDFSSGTPRRHDAIWTCMGGENRPVTVAAELDRRELLRRASARYHRTLTRRCRRRPAEATTRASLPKRRCCPAGRAGTGGASTSYAGAEALDMCRGGRSRAGRNLTSRIGGCQENCGA